MILSQKRKQAIFDAVHEEIMQLRISLAKGLLKGKTNGSKIDGLIAQAGTKAGEAAIKAAQEGK